MEFDVLGMVVKTAVMGKEGTNDGDTFDQPGSRRPRRGRWNLLALENGGLDGSNLESIELSPGGPISRRRSPRPTVCKNRLHLR